MEAVIGIDIGTTGCKATVFDFKGAIAGESYVEYPLKVLSSTYIEQESEDWWNYTVGAVGTAIANSGLKSSCIRAVSVSSQGISVVPVNENCTPLSSAISWLDTRAEAQAAMIKEKAGEDFIYGITGKRINPAYILPKLLWVKEKQPDIYKAAYKFLMPHDFIISRLTGEFVTDHTMAGGSLLYDLAGLSWNDEIAGIFDIDIHKLPEISWSGEVVGKPGRKASAELGLSSDVLVCVGAQDQKAAALGADLNYSDATISLGTAGAIEALSAKPVLDPLRGIPCFTFMSKGQWVLEAVVPTTGASLKWLRNKLFPADEYKELDLMAQNIPAGSNGIFFYPHLAGAGSPYWNSDARGMLWGVSLSTEKQDIVRAVLEGIGFQLKTNLDRIEGLGVCIETLKVFGGGSRSKVWCNIIANITGKRVIAYDSPEIASLGAGILAAKGCGIYSPQFGKALKEKNTVFNAEKSTYESYKGIYEKYLSMERKMI